MQTLLTKNGEGPTDSQVRTRPRGDRSRPQDCRRLWSLGPRRRALSIQYLTNEATAAGSSHVRHGTWGSAQPLHRRDAELFQDLDRSYMCGALAPVECELRVEMPGGSILFLRHSVGQSVWSESALDVTSGIGVVGFTRGSKSTRYLLTSSISALSKVVLELGRAVVRLDVEVYAPQQTATSGRRQVKASTSPSMSPNER